jgi:urease accessory protein
MFGALMAFLAVDRRETLRLYLYTSVKGVAAAGVRLGVVGPYEAQRLQLRYATLMDDVVTYCEPLGPGEATTVVPLFDVAGAIQDRLYARLFQS